MTTTAPLAGLHPRAEPEDVAAYEGQHHPHPAGQMPRMPAACVCGWHPHNHRPLIVADHLRDMADAGLSVSFRFGGDNR